MNTDIKKTTAYDHNTTNIQNLIKQSQIDAAKRKTKMNYVNIDDDVLVLVYGCQPVGVDLSVDHNQVCWQDEEGFHNIVMKDSELRLFISHRLPSLPPLLVTMENCSGANNWAIFIQEHGHRAKLVDCRITHKMVKDGNKTDFNDAFTLWRAARDTYIPSCRIRTPKELRLKSEMCDRDQHQKALDAQTNITRALLINTGDYKKARKNRNESDADHVMQQAHNYIERNKASADPEVIAQRTTLSRHIIQILNEKHAIAAVDNIITGYIKEDPDCLRLVTIPSVGPTLAASVKLTVGDISRFNCQRDLCAYLGFVPSHESTGGQPKSGHQVRNGNHILKGLLYEGVVSLYRKCKKEGCDPQSQWIIDTIDRFGDDFKGGILKVCSKVISIIYGVLKHKKPYDPKRNTYSLGGMKKRTRTKANPQIRSTTSDAYMQQRYNNEIPDLKAQFADEL